ncbi:hypothetical protein V2A60_008813 [Cordyceps javanica]
MFALADLLNPPPSQEGRAPEAVMIEADAPANSDPNTANEQILSNDAKSAKHSAQTRKTASLIGSAVSSETESSSLPALPSDVNTLACLSQHELSPSKQPRAGKSISKRTIYYDGREWEYKGYKWVKQGILSLRLMPVRSNETIELVHERDVQLDNQKGLLELWKGIGRPKPKNRMYQPLRILDETEDEKFELQWTGFDEESYSLEPVSKMWKVAPGLVDEAMMGPSPNHSSVVIVYKRPWMTLVLTSIDVEVKGGVDRVRSILHSAGTPRDSARILRQRRHAPHSPHRKPVLTSYFGQETIPQFSGTTTQNR